MLNCKLCGVPLPIAADGEILSCLHCRVNSLELLVNPKDYYKTAEALSEGAVMGTVGLLQELALFKQEQEDLQACCRGNYERELKLIQLHLEKLHDLFITEIIKIKNYLKWLKNK